MIRERVVVLLWLGACALEPPPAPKAIDCTTDRAAERYPDDCGSDADGGSESGDQP